MHEKLITKNNKNLSLHFLKLTNFFNQVIMWKENKNLQKGGKYAKITKNGFMKIGCSKKKEHLRKKILLWRANCISIDKLFELYIEMLSYNFT